METYVYVAGGLAALVVAYLVLRKRKAPLVTTHDTDFRNTKTGGDIINAMPGSNVNTGSGNQTVQNKE